METVLIEIKNEKAMKELEKMESKLLIKLIKKETIEPLLSKKFRNSISSELADKINEHISESRAEWDYIY